MEDIFIFIRQDEEYSSYFYLKDTVLNPNKDNLSIQLQNDSGIIEIKFRVDKLKILMKADTLYLMDIFLEGFPFYDPSSKDLPNLFDSDE